MAEYHQQVARDLHKNKEKSVSGYMPKGTVPSRPRRPRCGVKHAWQKDPIGLPLYVDIVSGRFDM